MAADGEEVGIGTGEWVVAGAGVASGERGLWLAGAVAADGGVALELSSSCTEREREWFFPEDIYYVTSSRYKWLHQEVGGTT
jgi:hypothetical protein